MAVSISVASGKGGVGKTSIAVNLALTMAGMGSRVTFLDADFGLANAHLLLGKTRLQLSRRRYLEKLT